MFVSAISSKKRNKSYEKIINIIVKRKPKTKITSLIAKCRGISNLGIIIHQPMKISHIISRFVCGNL
jgi:hypothetical protein